MGGELDQLAEEDRKALRGSKFAPLPSLSSTSRPPQPRLAHPGGPLRTNKAAALAKFLERKLQDPNGLASLNPDLIELAVKNAKETVKASSSGSGKVIQHVTSFDDPEDAAEETKHKKPKKLKMKLKKQKKKKNKALKAMIDS
uniref:Uncharacterized protein n=1 Tax=Kalanchoe fedtschenkoi TaxID=63787 RepID=A0A7N0T2I2_KALFE